MPSARTHTRVQAALLVGTLVAGLCLIAWVWATRPLGPFDDSSSEAASAAYSILIAAAFYFVHLVFVLIVLIVAIASRGHGGLPLTLLLALFSACTIAYPIALITRWLGPLGILTLALVAVSWLSLILAIAADFERRKPTALVDEPSRG